MEYSQTSAALIFTASTVMIVISIMLMASAWKSLKEIIAVLPTGQRRVTWFDHPVLCRTKVAGFPWDFSQTPASIRREAPEFGQHTEEILLELSYTWDDITKLRDEKAIL